MINIEWIYLFDLCGAAVFALSGALAAGKHRMDPFGVIVLASVTAVGGGSIRDAITGSTPVFGLLILITSLLFLRQYLHVLFSLESPISSLLLLYLSLMHLD